MCSFFVIFKQRCFLNNGQSKADTYTELLHFKPTFMIDYRSYSKYSLQIPHPYRYNDVALQGSGELYPYFAAEAFVFILLPEFIIKAITEWGEGRNQREGYRNLVPRVFKISTFASNARRGPFSPVYVIIRELKIDNAASSKTGCQYISTGRSFLEFDCFNNHLKLVLVTYKYFCWPKRYAFCYKLDFQNASYVVACFRVAQGTR